MKNHPIVSVVMSVYNGESMLEAAIKSILDQTFSDFEFIIINDGSTDKTAKIIDSFEDPRIKVSNQTNHGLIYSLNLGIQKSKGDYIARMDADDLSDPHRLEQQTAYLQANPKIDLVGSAFAMIDDTGKTLEVYARPTRDIDIKRQLFAHNPLGHGSVMVRKQTLVDAGGYTANIGPVEDYDLWIRLHLAGASFSVIPQALYKWRNNPAGVSSQNADLQRELVKKLRDDLWSTSIPPTMTIRQLLSGLAWYRAQSGDYAQQVAREYVYDQHRLAKQYAKHHHPVLALKQWLGFALMPSYAAPIMFGYVQDKVIGALKHLKHRLKSWLGLQGQAS